MSGQQPPTPLAVYVRALCVSYASAVNLTADFKQHDDRVACRVQRGRNAAVRLPHNARAAESRVSPRQRVSRAVINHQRDSLAVGKVRGLGRAAGTQRDKLHRAVAGVDLKSRAVRDREDVYEDRASDGRVGPRLVGQGLCAS